MPRTRDIRPGFFKNEYLAELPALTRILFAGLWTLADKEGRLEDRPKRIKLDTLPFDDCDIDASLNELHSAGFIKRYKVGNQMLIQITKWADNQKPHPKEAPSIYPSPELAETLSESEPFNYTASSGNTGTNNAITSYTSIPSITSMPSLNSTAVEKRGTIVPTPKFEERHLTLATEFWELVHEKYPYYKPPKLEAWAVTIRKMEEIDGFTIDEIEDVAAWALTKSEFWSQQIRGPDNLRKHFTKLLDQSGLYAVWERQRNGITTQGNYNRTNP